MSTRLVGLGVKEISLVERKWGPGPANKKAKVLFSKANKQTKSEGGKQFPASDYAYVPDAESPSTWKLRLTSEPGGDPDPAIVGAAAVALGAGFRGQKVEIPEQDRAGVVARVRSAWKRANPEKDEDQMPEGIAKTEDEKTAVSILGKIFKLLRINSGGNEETEEGDVAENKELLEKIERLEKANKTQVAAAKIHVAIGKADAKGLDALDTEASALEFAEGDPMPEILKAASASRREALVKSAGDAKYDAFRKTLPEAMRGPFDAMTEDEKKNCMDTLQAKTATEKAMDAITAENKTLKADVEKIRHERAVEKVLKTELADMGEGDGARAVAESIVKLRATDADAAEVLVKNAKAMAAQLKTAGLFKTLGSDGVDDGGAAGKIEKMAKTLAEKDNIPYAKAFTKVCQANPELYTEMAAEKD